jgi:predicted double-glycine peptidase
MKLLNIKPFQETLNAGMCGPASLKMVLDYWGVDKTEKELGELCGTDAELGTDDSVFKRVAESIGFRVEIKNSASFEDIEYWLNREMPIIVDWFTRGRSDYSSSEVPDGHYSVVVGLDDEFIYLQDPEIGESRKIRRGDFLKVWFDFRGTMIDSWDDMIIRQIIVVHPV